MDKKTNRDAFLWKAVCMVQPQQHKNVEGVTEPAVGSTGLPVLCVHPCFHNISEYFACLYFSESSFS